MPDATFPGSGSIFPFSALVMRLWPGRALPRMLWAVQHLSADQRKPGPISLVWPFWSSRRRAAPGRGCSSRLGAAGRRWLWSLPAGCANSPARWGSRPGPHAPHGCRVCKASGPRPPRRPLHGRNHRRLPNPIPLRQILPIPARQRQTSQTRPHRHNPKNAHNPQRNAPK